MAAANNGGFAFPRPLVVTTQGIEDDAETGMTLRDWFAGMALQGYLSSFAGLEDAGFPSSAKCALLAYRIADAMLREREAG